MTLLGVEVMGNIDEIGRREKTRTSDPHHVNLGSVLSYPVENQRKQHLLSTGEIVRFRLMGSDGYVGVSGKQTEGKS